MGELLIALCCAWLSGFFMLAAMASATSSSSSSERGFYTSDGIRLIGMRRAQRSTRPLCLFASIFFALAALVIA